MSRLLAAPGSSAPAPPPASWMAAVAAAARIRSAEEERMERACSTLLECDPLQGQGQGTELAPILAVSSEESLRRPEPENYEQGDSEEVKGQEEIKEQRGVVKKGMLTEEITAPVTTTEPFLPAGTGLTYFLSVSMSLLITYYLLQTTTSGGSRDRCCC